MHDMLTTILLLDHFSRRHRRVERETYTRPEPDSPWSRIFAWHRRNTCQ